MSRYFEDFTLKELINSPNEYVPPMQLYGDFLHAEELGILFSDSGTGKTITLWDIAISIGTGINHWSSKMSETSLDVFVLDLEMSPQQTANRMNRYEEIATDRIHLKTLRPESMGRITPEILVSEVEYYATDSSVIIIDNISALEGSGLSIKQMKSLMMDLRQIISSTGCTILLLAHTTKRNMKKPLTQNDLGGSKMIVNFVDTAFALSLSVKDESTRYLKMVKARNCRMLDKVAELEIVEEPYLHMEFVEWNDEEEHIEKTNARKKKYDETDVEEVLSLEAEGYSCREIEKELGLSKSTVNRIIQQHK